MTRIARARAPAVLAAAIILAIGFVAGCGAKYWAAPIEPETKIGFNPWTRTIELRDTKNNDFTLKGLRSTGDSGQLTSLDIDELTITNNSSGVIAADAARMEAVDRLMVRQLELHQIMGQNLVQMTQLITAAVAQLAPYLRAPPVVPTDPVVLPLPATGVPPGG